MKIYNKKNFISGIFMVILSFLNFGMDVIRNTIEIKGIVLATVLFLMGGTVLFRSLSQRLSQEDKLEKLDERNQLIELKSQSKAFRLTQTITFVLLLVGLVVGGILDSDGCIAFALGLAFSFSISMWTELSTSIYYEYKN